MHTGVTRNKQHGLCNFQKMTGTVATLTVLVSATVTFQTSYSLFLFTKHSEEAKGASGLAALL